MIAGATRGAGGTALSRHLLSRKDGQKVLVMPSRGLAAEDLKDQIAEIVADAVHGRTDRPIHHVHVDPPPDASNSNEIIGVFLRHYEAEFGLRDHQRAGVFHLKGGRQHAHVVYSLVGRNGRVADLQHEYARREKICRITEFECGLRFIKGRHNRAVEQALRKEGRIEIADAMIVAGLLDGCPGIAHSTPRQRAQAERTAVPIDEIRSAVLAAWRASEDARSFAVALHAFGSVVATGRKGLLLVDRGGGTHSLNRTLAAAARVAGEDRITAAAVRRRLAGITFLKLEEILNARTSRPNTGRSAGSQDELGTPATSTRTAQGGRRGDQSARRIDELAAADPRSSWTSAGGTAARRKRARDRATAAALGRIDLQQIIAKGKHMMKELKAQDYKAKMLAGFAPRGFNAHAFTLDLHMVKAPSEYNLAGRIMVTDGGWVEYNPSARSVRTWGPSGRAKVLAQALADVVGCEVYHLAKTASIAANADALKVTKVADDTIKGLVAWWVMRGFDAAAAPDGCWLTAGTARLLDTGNRLEVHGGLTDQAVAAILTKAKGAWGSSLKLEGRWTQAEQDHLWIAAMRAGVAIHNCGPSQGIQAAWRREKDAATKSARTISSVKSEIIEAQHLIDAAKGDIEAAKKLSGNLQAFVGVYLDDEQRKELAAQPIAEIVPHLGRFRRIGTVELESYEAPTGPKVAFVEPEKDKPKQDAEKTQAPK